MTIDDIYNKLSVLNPTFLEIIDESGSHIGHSGYNPSGISHIKIKISSNLLDGLSKIKQHRLIYVSLSDMIKRDQIHAISIEII
jgi:BolA protein